MAFRLVDTNWWAHFERALRVDRSELRIVSPFIKVGALNRLLPLGVERVRVITRYNLNDFASRASDIESLHTLLGHGAPVRGIRHLHAKFYVIGQSAAIVTSANLTSAGFASNHEFGVVVDDREAIATCCEKFEDLWRRGRRDLTHEEADAWTAELVRHRLAGGRVADSGTLSDYGADGGFVEPSPIGVPALFADAEHGFVKFHGARDHRAPPSTKTLDEVKASGCHRVVSYPDGRRPRGVEDGDVMFIARLTRERALSRIFGRAIAVKHEPGRDDATRADIELRPWRRQWPHFVRVHDAEFLNGTLANGVSLGELIDALGTDSFESTQRRAARGETDINPRLSVRQQPAVRLSRHGREWLNERLQAAFALHGPLPPSALDGHDWPESPGGRQ